jgi:hypothetical protein
MKLMLFASSSGAAFDNKGREVVGMLLRLVATWVSVTR